MDFIAKVFAGLVLGIGFAVLLVGLSALFALPVLWLINFLFTPSILHAVFGTGAITFTQAWGLTVLCGFLFKSTSSK